MKDILEKKKKKKSSGVQSIFPWLGRNMNILKKCIYSIASEMQIIIFFFVLEDEIQELYISLGKKNKKVLKNINHSNIAGFFLGNIA